MNGNNDAADARTELTNSHELAALETGDTVEVTYESKYAARGNEQTLTGTIESRYVWLTPEDDDGYYCGQFDIRTDEGELRRLSFDATPTGSVNGTVKTFRGSHDTRDHYGNVTCRSSSFATISRPTGLTVYEVVEDVFEAVFDSLDDEAAEYAEYLYRFADDEAHLELLVENPEFRHRDNPAAAARAYDALAEVFGMGNYGSCVADLQAEQADEDEDDESGDDDDGFDEALMAEMREVAESMGPSEVEAFETFAAEVGHETEQDDDEQDDEAGSDEALMAEMREVAESMGPSEVEAFEAFAAEDEDDEPELVTDGGEDEPLAVDEAARRYVEVLEHYDVTTTVVNKGHDAPFAYVSGRGRCETGLLRAESLALELDGDYEAVHQTPHGTVEFGVTFKR